MTGQNGIDAIRRACEELEPAKRRLVLEYAIRLQSEQVDCEGEQLEIPVGCDNET